MPELSADSEAGKKVVIATIANRKDPTQIVEIVHQPDRGIFVTQGIAPYFRLKEIAVPQNLMLAEIQELTKVLSYLLERIATAGDLNLPFRYDPEFEFGDRLYRLDETEEHMLLAPKE
jgi:hypothetical protein